MGDSLSFFSCLFLILILEILLKKLEICRMTSFTTSCKLFHKLLYGRYKLISSLFIQKSNTFFILALRKLTVPERTSSSDSSMNGSLKP